MSTRSGASGRLVLVAVSAVWLALAACADDDNKAEIGGACANNTDCADSLCHADPLGYCLDTTTSGSSYRSPLPTP